MKLKVHHHHRGIAGMFVAASLLYYFGLTSHQSSASMLDCSTASSINVPAIECQGLVELYNNMGGPSWLTSTNWNTDTNVCTWAGIICENIAGQDHVRRLNLASNNLVGALLPSSMSGLSYITGIDLSDNNFSGTLPASWSTWTGIEYFNFQGSSLGFLYGMTGTLPTEWSTWENIKYFNVSSNKIGGALPTSWSTWQNIEEFNVSSNQLIGSLPASWSTWGGVGPANSIQYFNVGRNLLTGTLPTAWAPWIHIKEFKAYENSIGGTGPWSAWIDWLPSLEVFNLSSNALTGELPAIWGDVGDGVAAIRELNLFGNDLNGTLPANWRTFRNTLELLNLSENNLTGQLPTEWSLLTALKQIHLSANTLNGILLPEYSAWTNIEEARFDSNNFSGTLPTEWSGWNSSIKRFRVCYNNQLTGSLPAEWSSRTNINYFCATNSNLRGTLPASWSTWNKIDIFYINNNNFTGALPTSWSAWTGVSFFIANNNHLNGTLSADWSGWNRINMFDVGNNQLAGNLPGEWSAWGDTLNSFYVNNNQLTGTLPASWSTWTTIKNLFLQNNLLEGEVPGSWTTMSALTTPLGPVDGLHLENNCLETDLPEPPASFIEIKAGTGWESSQALCNIESDLVITKSNSIFSTGKISNTYTYTIHYINSGAMAISGVTIYDRLITGFSYDNATPSATIITGQEVSWNIGMLNPMQSGDITLTVSIGNSFFSGDTATNTATISGILTDLDTGNNMSITPPITIIGIPTTGDLAIEKTAMDISATAGDTISYEIEFTNQQITSGSIPSAFTISDTLPAELTYVSTNFGSLYDFSTGITVSGNHITWDFWNVNSDSTGKITVYAEINGDVSSGTLISNSASITGTIEDQNRVNNTSTANDILVFGALFTGDLAVTKSSSHTGAYSGDIITFTIVYSNNGENAVTGISLLDIMSPDLAYLTSSIAPDTITGNISYTSFYRYLSTGLAAHSSGTITMQAQVITGSSGGSLRNSVQIESSFPTDIDNDNNTSNVNFPFLVANDISGDSFSIPPNSDETWSYAGPGGWDPPRITYHTITGETYMTTTGIAELGAPTLLEDETCMYNDGDFEKFKTTFKDIQNSIFKQAVDTMLDYCLVQGEYNKGKMFGVYNYLRWGEAYKIFGRLAGVDFTKKTMPTHWSDTYRFAGMKLNLWASTTSQPHHPKSYISYADIFTIGNNILRYYKKPPLEYNPELNYNNAISRGKFALFIAELITTIKQ